MLLNIARVSKIENRRNDQKLLLCVIESPVNVRFFWSFVLISHICVESFRYLLMMDCWNVSPGRRPSFNELAERCQQLVESSDVTVRDKWMVFHFCAEFLQHYIFHTSGLWRLKIFKTKCEDINQAISCSELTIETPA